MRKFKINLAHLEAGLLALKTYFEKYGNTENVAHAITDEMRRIATIAICL
jgi:hypothetical protein